MLVLKKKNSYSWERKKILTFFWNEIPITWLNMNKDNYIDELFLENWKKQLKCFQRNTYSSDFLDAANYLTNDFHNYQEYIQRLQYPYFLSNMPLMTGLVVSWLTGQQKRFRRSFQPGRSSRRSWRKSPWQGRVKLALRVLGRSSTRIRWRDFSGRWREPQEAIGRFRAGRDLSKWRWKSLSSGDGGGVQGRSNCEERRARCHDSTNGWPLHQWNAWCLTCVVCYVSAPEGRAPVALETSLNVRYRRPRTICRHDVHQRCALYCWTTRFRIFDEGRERQKC